MSTTRSIAMAAFASAGILAAGWQLGTAGGAAVPSTTTTTSGTTESTASGTTAGTTAGTTSSGSDSSTTTSGTDSGTSTSGTTASSSGTSSSGTTASGTTASGTFTGTTATHRYGSVTVTVTLVNGEITALSEDVVSDGDHHSDRINAQAVPMVKSEILAANSADVSTIGGATYTTEAYLTSLQSALDQAA